MVLINKQSVKLIYIHNVLLCEVLIKHEKALICMTYTINSSYDKTFSFIWSIITFNNTSESEGKVWRREKESEGEREILNDGVREKRDKAAEKNKIKWSEKKELCGGSYGSQW